jgi:hypothetical protein
MLTPKICTMILKILKNMSNEPKWTMIEPLRNGEIKVGDLVKCIDDSEIPHIGKNTDLFTQPKKDQTYVVNWIGPTGRSWCTFEGTQRIMVDGLYWAFYVKRFTKVK